MTRVALDTNILVYAEGLQSTPSDQPKVDTARRLMRGLILSEERPVIPVQVLAELHRVLQRKGGLARSEVAERVARFRSLGDIVATTPDTFDLAVTLAGAHDLPTFDAIILAAAVQSRCDLLVSEDLHDGFTWRGVTVSNPFGLSPDRRIARLLTPTP